MVKTYYLKIFILLISLSSLDFSNVNNNSILIWYYDCENIGFVFKCPAFDSIYCTYIVKLHEAESNKTLDTAEIDCMDKVVTDSFKISCRQKYFISATEITRKECVTYFHGPLYSEKHFYGNGTCNKQEVNSESFVYSQNCENIPNKTDFNRYYFCFLIFVPILVLISLIGFICCRLAHPHPNVLTTFEEYNSNSYIKFGVCDNNIKYFNRI